MNLRKVIAKRIRHTDGGIDFVGDVNAVISANVGERGTHNKVSSSQRIVQRAGRTEVSEQRPDASGPPGQ